MARGGPRPGAGRKAGSPNKATQERQQAVAESGLTPLDYLLSVMRNTELNTDGRLEAAKAAAPYVHPRLAAVTVAGDPEAPLHTVTRIELVAPDHDDSED